MIKVEKDRIDYIDIYRCVGILLMIGGHVGFGDRYSHLIHAFHMPMFFIVTGFFIEKFLHRNFWGFIRRLFISLIVPYVSVGFFHYILWLIIRRMGIQFGGDIESSVAPLISLLWDNTKGLPIAGALWFLTALFFSEIIYYVLNRVSSKVIRISLVLIIPLFGNYWRSIGGAVLPYAIDAAMVGVGFIAAGHFYSVEHSKMRSIKSKWYHSLVLLFGLSILSFANDSVGMNTGKYGIIPIFWICAVGISITIMILSKIVAPFMEKNITIIYNVTTDIGRNSIIYLCFNQICIGVTMRILESLTDNRLTVAILTFVFTVLELRFVCVLIMSTKMKKIFGK